MREKDFMQAVIKYARWNSWKVYHTFDSRRSEPGFPDLVMVRDGEVVFAEIKNEKGRLTEAQEDWLARLLDIRSVSTCVWRPSDMDLIIDMLKRIS